LALVLVLAGLSASACGATHTTTSAQTVSRSASRRTRRSPNSAKPPAPPRGAPPPSLPRLGASRRVRAPGTTLLVTIRSIIDPLRNSAAQAGPGTKAVAIRVAVRDLGPDGYDSSATGDFSLTSATGEASPVFVAKGVCQTPLQDFMNAIAPGQLRTGCVAFSIPNRQQPITVGFAPDGGSGGPRRLWSAR
jgi:Domain of unknown function (DUF4352)